MGRFERVRLNYDKALAAADRKMINEARPVLKQIIQELKRELGLKKVTLLFGMGSWSMSSQPAKFAVKYSDENEDGEMEFKELKYWEKNTVWRPKNEKVLPLVEELFEACDWLAVEANVSTMVTDIHV